MPVRHQTRNPARPQRPDRRPAQSPGQGPGQGPGKAPTTRPGPSTADAPGTVLLLTDDEELAAAVARLAAATGCVLRRSCEGAEGGPSTDPARTAPAPAPDLVLLGVDAHPPLDAPFTELVVVGRAPVGPDWWQAASALEADHAVLLPEAEDWLLDRLSDIADGPGRRGPVVGVVGGTGGAGASVLAAGLARALADTAGGALLIDADPRSGGLDLLVGGDALPGLRWDDLTGVAGRLSPAVLRSAVDLGAGLHVLAAGRRGGGGPGAEELWTVLDAARRSFPATVLDLPRGGLGGLGAVLGACAEVLVVTPGTTRGAAAAGAVVDEVRATCATDVRLVVRDVGAGPDPEDVADAAGVPLAGVVRPDRDLDAALELGEGVPGGRRSSLRSFAMACARDLPAFGVPLR